jgi:hypothetical protein
MLDTFARRRALLGAVASLLLLPIPGVSAEKEGAPGKVLDEKKSGKGSAKKSTGVVLTVVVTGAGKAISQAEVQLKFPASVGGESTVPTNQAGEVTFNSAAVGTAKLRVLAVGWESAFQEVELKEGPQRVTIKLKSLQDGK